MNILVLSDLHIDTGDRFSTFGWKAKRFIRTIEQIVERYNVAQVVLNGDIFDLYKHNFKEIYPKNYELISYFNRKGFIYLRGNHDLFNPFAKDFHQVVNSQGQVVHIEHGHDADFLNGTGIGRAISRAAFLLLKRLVWLRWVERAYFKLIEYNDEVNRIPKKYNTYRYLKYALKLLRQYDMVILGHTHKLESHKTYFLSSRKVYLNSGTCSLGRLQALIVNTETLKYETLKIGKGESLSMLEPHPKRVGLKIQISA